MSHRDTNAQWKVKASSIARNTHNPIRKIVENLRVEPHPDKPLIALSIGDPTIFGNLKPPKEAIDAVIESVQSYKFNGYAPSVGYYEAREAVARYSAHQGDVAPEDVILCSGCSHALDMSITVLAEIGQNILIPRPGFSIYKTLAEGLDIKTKYYNLLADRQWEIDLENLENQIDEDTAAIIVINPSNPCGSVYSKSHLEDILEIASRFRVPIIADEIYEQLVFPEYKFTAISSLSVGVPILTCSGLTKRFLVPGWRTGWIVVHDRNGVFGSEIRTALNNLSQRLIGSNTIVQGALPAILSATPQSYFDELSHTLKLHAKLAYDCLRRIRGLTPVMPQGAMYMMVGINLTLFPKLKSDMEFVERLVTEQSVFCLPGACFDFPNFMRIVLTVPEDMIIEACRRIAEFCATHTQNGCPMKIDGKFNCENNTIEMMNEIETV